MKRQAVIREAEEKRLAVIREVEEKRQAAVQEKIAVLEKRRDEVMKQI